jgi:predicted RNA-binding Zn-ribbon protein involved in translation (DUF1610 family)
MLKIKDLSAIERKPDGFLFKMTLIQQKEAVKLIKRLCSYYDKGDCLYLDGVCPQSISYSVNCKIFRRVLLEDKAGLALKAEIFSNDPTKYCAVCDAVIQSESNNAKYCCDCAKIIQRKQKAEHAKKQRSGVEK